MKEPFDYGAKQPDGQHERHPTITDGDYVRPLRRAYVHDACNQPTTLGVKIAQTFARDPSFYTHTFCAACRDYFPVAQFSWAGGEKVGT